MRKIFWRYTGQFTILSDAITKINKQEKEFFNKFDEYHQIILDQIFCRYSPTISKYKLIEFIEKHGLIFCKEALTYARYAIYCTCGHRNLFSWDKIYKEKKICPKCKNHICLKEFLNDFKELIYKYDSHFARKKLYEKYDIKPNITIDKKSIYL